MKPDAVEEGPASSTATASRPPRFSISPTDAKYGNQGNPSAPSPVITSATSGETPAIPVASASNSLGSNRDVLIAQLQEMGSAKDVLVVAEKMKKFIEIGECLGYDMKGCANSRIQMLQKMGEVDGLQ